MCTPLGVLVQQFVSTPQAGLLIIKAITDVACAFERLDGCLVIACLVKLAVHFVSMASYNLNYGFIMKWDKCAFTCTFMGNVRYS